MDLIDPGPGSQIVDIQPGIQPNGLFWTTQIPRSAFYARSNRAHLKLVDLPLVDTFQFGNANCVPATISLEVEWTSTATLQHRGKGTAVPPTDPAAFSATFATASSTGMVKGQRMGFGFEAHGLSSEGYYASMGHERNGVFLS